MFRHYEQYAVVVSSVVVSLNAPSSFVVKYDRVTTNIDDHGVKILCLIRSLSNCMV